MLTISLLIMGIIMVCTLSLTYIFNLEHLIFSSGKNSIQAYYAAEAKIYEVLNKREYYDQVLSRIERYIKLGRSGKPYDYEVILNNEDMVEGDNINKVKLSFDIENDRRILQLESSSIYNNINKKLIAKMTVVNDFYENGFSIISEDMFDSHKLEEYIDYIDSLSKKIEIPDSGDIMGIDASNFDSVQIIKGLNGKITVKYYRNDITNPIKEETLTQKYIFLITKSKNETAATISILSEDKFDKIDLGGVLYTEGDIEIQNNIMIKGILIVNGGRIIIHPSIDFEMEGLILLKDCVGNNIGIRKNTINYNQMIIKTHGIYLPGFIDPRILMIKSS